MTACDFEKSFFYYEAHLSLYIFRNFGEDQSMQCSGNIGNMCILATNSPMQMRHKISGATGPKFAKLLSDVE